MTVNVDKSLYILFIPSASNHYAYWSEKPCLQLNGYQLKFIHSYKYLGTELDEHLEFDKHFESVLKKARVKMYTLMKLGKFIDAEVAVRIYKTSFPMHTRAQLLPLR